MKINPTRYSSAIGEIWVMATFKIKYCHNIFDIKEIREACNMLLLEALGKYAIMHQDIGFDSNHVHIILEMGLNNKHQIAKKLRGFIAKKFFALLPWVKKRYFWDSGLWNPAYDIRSHDLSILKRYVQKQKYSGTGQTTLLMY